MPREQQQQRRRQRSESSQSSSNGNGGKQRQERNSRSNNRAQEYEEQDGWASAFHRPDNEGKQPQYTGQGLDIDGNPIEIAVWVKRAKSGKRYLRIHIQGPWEGGDNDDPLDDDEEEQADDDLPF